MQISATEGRHDEIRKSIEDLSGDSLYLYSYESEERFWYVLVAAEEGYQLEETMELLQSVFEVLELEMSMELAAKGSDLKELCQKESGADGDAEKREEKDAESVCKNMEMTRASEAKNDKLNDKKESNTACQIVAYIKENCTDYNMSLELVAQEFQITTSYLCRIIKQQIGMSYKEYLTELRIAEAKELLIKEDISVADVCIRVGYTNVSNFIRVFQKYSGMTPAKFRDSNVRNQHVVQ